MKKIIVFFFLSCWCSYGMTAQEYVKDIVTRLNTVDYIFEGKVIQTNPYKTTDEKLIYTSNTIEITRIFKGNLTCGTVEMITFGGWVGDEGLKGSHSLELNKGVFGVFLASETDREAPSVSFYPFDNLQKLEGVYENQSYIKYWYDFDDDIMKAADLSTMFYSVPDLYAFAQSITGQPIQDCNPNLSFDRRDMVTSDKIYDIRNYPKVVVPPSSEKLQKIAERDAIRSASSHTNTILAGNLQYNFSNDNVVSVITGTDTFKYVDFKIDLADDLPGKYLHFADFDIRYSGQAFGTNIDNILGAVQIFRGDVFLNATAYQDPLSNNTAVDTVLNVFVLPQQPYQNKRDLASSPEHALTVRFRLNVCELPDSINFDVYRSFSYSDTPSDPFGYQYSNTQNNNGFQLPPCNVQIDTFEIHPIKDTMYSTQWIRGGVGDTLIIKGKGFGNIKGQSTVLFKNANLPSTEIGLFDRDFDWDKNGTPEGWSDTLLIIKFPSWTLQADTVTGNSLPDISQNWGPVGSGKFKVIRHDPISNKYYGKKSKSILDVKFSVDTYFDIPFEYRLVNATLTTINNNLYNGDSVRVFTMSNSIKNYSKYPEFKACFAKALREWSCLTGIKWEVRETPINNNGLQSDSINNIYFDNQLIGSSAIGQAQPRIGGGCMNNMDTLFVLKEVDLALNPQDTSNWWFDTTFVFSCPPNKKDVYYMMVHELGHAHLINHVINEADIMFYGYGVNQQLVANRPSNLNNEPSAYYGGNCTHYHDFQRSVPCPLKYTPIGNERCHDSPLANELPSTFQYGELVLFPNPSSNKIGIDFLSAKTFDFMVIDVFDLLGNKLYETKLSNIREGHNIFYIDVRTWVSGIYFVTLKNNNGSIVKKFVKL